MRRISAISLIVSGLFLVLHSCQNENSYINKAEAVIEQYPDSALSFLDSMHVMGNMSHNDKQNSILLRIQAKDKLFLDITQDSLILELPTYFLEKNDYANASTASYYSGRYYHELEQSKLAMELYIEALNLSNNMDDCEDYKGILETNIGYLLYNESEYHEALERFSKAYKHFEQSNNIVNQINVKIELGNCHMVLQNCDSAYYYYNQSLELAKISNIIELELIALQNLSAVFQDQGKTDKAIELYKKALSITDNNMSKAQILLGITSVYFAINNLDSAKFYQNRTIQISQDIEEPYFKASLYNLSSKLSERLGNYTEALIEYKEYAKYLGRISTEKEKKSVLEIQKKYQFEQVKNQHSLLQIGYNRIVILCLILLIALSISSFIFHYIIKKKKRLLNEAENKISQLDELALSYDEKRNSFKDILLHHFDILTKSTMVKSYLRDDEIKRGEKIIKRFNEIVYKEQELNWQILYEVMDESHDHFPTKLKISVPELDEEEFQICCLIYATDFKNQEIGLILKASDSKITHKRSSIRRKMDMKEYSNIKERLEDIALNTSINVIK